MDEQFILILFKDIDTAKKKALPETVKSFPFFLETLSDAQLKYYSSAVEKLIDSDKYKPSTEDIQNVVLMHSYIIMEIENGAPNNTVKIDDEGGWVCSLYMFITMEKFLREGFIDEYSGFLNKGDLTFKPNQKMKDIGESMSNTLFDAHSILKNKKK